MQANRKTGLSREKKRQTSENLFEKNKIKRKIHNENENKTFPKKM